MVQIPEHVLAFVRDRINSVEQLEMLFLLTRNPEKEWTIKDLARALSTDPLAVTARLAQFQSLCIATIKTPQEVRYRYDPQISGLDQMIKDVEEAYGKFPVRLISLIYSKPIDNIRTFSDAFKLKKEDP